MYVRIYVVCIHVCVWLHVVVFCLYIFMYVRIIKFFTVPNFHYFFNKNLTVYSLWSGQHTHECLALNVLWQLPTADKHKFYWKRCEHTNPVHDGNAVLFTCRTSTAVLILPVVGASHVSCLAFYKQISANPAHNRQSHYFMPAAWKSEYFLNAVPFAANKSFKTPKWSVFALPVFRTQTFCFESHKSRVSTKDMFCQIYIRDISDTVLHVIVHTLLQAAASPPFLFSFATFLIVIKFIIIFIVVVVTIVVFLNGSLRI